jgi:hypothetical protein
MPCRATNVGEFVSIIESKGEVSPSSSFPGWWVAWMRGNSIGLIDDCFCGSGADFGSILTLAQKSQQFSRCSRVSHMLRENHERRIGDEEAKPLARYRAEERARMRENFYSPDQTYHAARQRKG